MSETTIAFVDDLVRRFPNLGPLLDEHIRDFDVVLPHLFMADLERYVGDLFRRSQTDIEDAAALRAEVKQIMDALEAGYAKGPDEIEELISVSFLEHLSRPRVEPGWEIRALVGPRMARQLKVIG